MPVAQTKIRTSVVVGLAAIITAIGLFTLVVILSRNEVSFGPDKFKVGSAESLAKTIAEDRRPFLFGDLAGGNRPIWVQHLGDDPQQGWYAFEAQVGQCAIQWDIDGQEFVDDCTHARYPRNGEGLGHYPVTIEKGKVIVDLNPDDGND